MKESSETVASEETLEMKPRFKDGIVSRNNLLTA